VKKRRRVKQPVFGVRTGRISEEKNVVRRRLFRRNRFKFVKRRQVNRECIEHWYSVTRFSAEH